MADIPKQDPALKVQVYHDTTLDLPDEGASYMHCSRCLLEWRMGLGPPGQSPRDYARQQVLLTSDGIQVWCTRHDVNITRLHLRAVRKEEQ